MQSSVQGKYSPSCTSNARQPDSVLFRQTHCVTGFVSRFSKTNNGLFLIQALKSKPVADSPTNAVVSLYRAASSFSVTARLCRRGAWVLQLLQRAPDSPSDNGGCRAVGRLKDGTLNTRVQEMGHTGIPSLCSFCIKELDYNVSSGRAEWGVSGREKEWSSEVDQKKA